MSRTWRDFAQSKSAAASFRRRVREAANYRCESEIRHGKGEWKRCNSQDRCQVSHLIKRVDCVTLVSHPIVGWLQCWTCHAIFGHNLLGTPPYEVRLPKERYDRAYRAVTYISKTAPKRRLA